MSVASFAQLKAEITSKQAADFIWSPLTKLESNTLNNSHLAESGDPDALLALAVLASGDTRSYEEFVRIKSKIDQFVIRLKPRISQQKNSWRKGFELHSAMHDEFFLPNETYFELEGYSANQSQISGIFKDKTYNCISSSLLFLILARYFDLQVEGVLLPTHSYIQLTTPEGQVIEIETTSKTGFGVRHNRAFYESSDRQKWFRVRSLIPTTHEDYLNREVVSGYQLIIDNMNHQHTARDKMSRGDRYRLQEIRGWLLPDDSEAQLYRFYALNNELIQLKKDKQFLQAKALIKLAETLVDSYRQKLKSDQVTPLISGSEINLDGRVFPIIAFMFSSKAGIAFAEGDYQKAIDNFKEALLWIGDPAQADKIIRNTIIARLNQGNKFSRKKDYLSALKLYQQAYSSFNSHLAVGEITAEDKELASKINYNIGTAYWNMTIPYLKKGDSYSAYELLDQCLTQYPQLQKCQQGIDKICRTYSLPVCSN